MGSVACRFDQTRIQQTLSHEIFHSLPGRVAVSGDAKPWTVAQVAAGAPAKNALAEGRLHNIGVITNAAEAGVTQVGGVALNYAAPVVSYAAAVPALHHGVYYGKREAKPYTLGQVATGQTNGGALTFVDAGHGTGHRPVVATAPVVSYAASPVHYAAAFPALHHGVYYGKREAEASPYTIGQVAAGLTNGGVITSVGGVPVVPHHAPVAAAVPAATYAYAAHVPHTYGSVYYGK